MEKEIKNLENLCKMSEQLILFLKNNVDEESYKRVEDFIHSKYRFWLPTYKKINDKK